jgi:hypothetical protein
VVAVLLRGVFEEEEEEEEEEEDTAEDADAEDDLPRRGVRNTCLSAAAVRCERLVGGRWTEESEKGS